MKASKLHELIRRWVREELQSQLPLVLSEMYLRRFIAENVVTPEQPRAQARTTYQQVLEQAGVAPRQPQQAAGPDRAAIREKIRKTILDDPDENPLAALYADVEPAPPEHGMGALTAEAAIAQFEAPEHTVAMPIKEQQAIEVAKRIDPVQIAGVFDPERMQRLLGNTRGPMRETPEMAERRLAMHRARLDQIPASI